MRSQRKHKHKQERIISQGLGSLSERTKRPKCQEPENWVS